MQNNELIVRVRWTTGIFYSHHRELTKPFQPPEGHVLLGTRLLQDGAGYLLFYVDTIHPVTQAVNRGTQFFGDKKIPLRNIEEVYVTCEKNLYYP